MLFRSGNVHNYKDQILNPCSDPTQILRGSLATAAPSTVILSPIFTVSFLHPPRTSA
jgi:hypothetical protein